MILRFWDKGHSRAIAIASEKIVAFTEITSAHGGTNIVVEGLREPVWVQESYQEVSKRLEEALGK